ncbi:hypothetical protein [Vibrio sp. HN007]|uniref:hypothetical protein n=1 Tax=Vibrio iocasae TaxID=3098914 RepID=UPI0035D4D071
MNTQYLALTTVALSVALAACGGGGGGSSSTSPSQPSTPTAKVSGLAIDGYVEGATAFLDYNFNDQWDEGEPTAKTDQNGRFEFTDVLDTCQTFSPVVIDVPVGAYDSDYGAVSEAYRLTFPPKFSSDNTSDDLWTTTPFTTVIWNSIKQELEREGMSDCHALAEDNALQARIKQRVAQQEFRLAGRYNMTVKDLYGDFIASGNDTQHKLAQRLVVGMAKAFQETTAFEKANPDANEAYVEYYLGNPESDSSEVATKWYRREWIGSPTHSISKVFEVSDDLQTIGKMVDYLENTKTVANGVGHSRYIVMSAMLSDNYSCMVQDRASQDAEFTTVTETITEKDEDGNDVEKEVTRVVSNVIYEFSARADSTVNTVDECKALDTQANLSSSIVTAYQKRDIGSFLKYAQFDFSKGDNTDVDDLMNSLVQNTITEPGRLDSVNYMKPDIAETDSYNAGTWIRINYEYPTAGGSIVTQHRNTGLWIERTTHANGTYSIQCGKDKANLQSVDSESVCLNM